MELAGRFLRGETTPDAVRPDPNGPKIGVSHPRPSGMLKACGLAAFGADIVVPGALDLAVVRSPHAHAAIKAIDVSRGRGDARSRGRDDGDATSKARTGCSWPPSATGPCCARTRCGSSATRWSSSPPIPASGPWPPPRPSWSTTSCCRCSSRRSRRWPTEPSQLHEQWPNLCLTQAQVKGDAAAALAGSAATIEARFNTQINHQAPLEPEAAVAYLEGEGEDAQLVVIGRSINIHKALAMLQDALGWENTRYEEAYTGGQFGIKVEITSEGIAGAAALHFRRPVRYIPGLTDTLLLTPKRHPFDLSVALGADAEGHLTGYTMDVTVDNGAYFSSGQVVVYRSVLMLSGSYNIPNVDALLRLVYTNNPWGAAARGAGPPQMNFALECAMEMLARKMGIDPLDFRVRNSLQPGQTKSTGQVVEEWPLPGLFDAIRPDYERSRREAESHRTGTVRRGVGLGAGSFGIGAPGDQSMVAVELDLDGGVTIYAAVADPGEGNDSMLTQLAADAMGLPLDMIRLVTRDTDQTTANGPAAASRMTYMAGGALLNALDSLKQAMAEAGARTRQELLDAGLKARHTGTKKTREAGPLDENGQGPSFESQVHAVQLAEVEVDIETGRCARRAHDHRRRRRNGAEPPEPDRTARRRRRHGSGLRPAGAVHRRPDQGLGHLRLSQHAHGLRHERHRPGDAAEVRNQRRRGRRRDDHGAHRAGGHQRHPRRRRRVDLRPAGDPGQGQGGPGSDTRVDAAVQVPAQSGDPRGLSHVREIAGRRILFDAEGFLWRADDWSEEVAEALARESGLDSLDETRWRVIHFLREYYLENGRSPLNRALAAGNRHEAARTRGPLPGRDQARSPAGGGPAQPQELHVGATEHGRSPPDLSRQRRDQLPQAAGRARSDGGNLRAPRGLAGARELRPVHGGRGPGGGSPGQSWPASSALPIRIESSSPPTPPTP